MHDDDPDREEEAPVVLEMTCAACGALYLWRVGNEPEDACCPSCRVDRETAATGEGE